MSRLSPFAPLSGAAGLVLFSVRRLFYSLFRHLFLVIHIGPVLISDAKRPSSDKNRHAVIGLGLCAAKPKAQVL